MLIVLNDEEIEYNGEASILELLQHLGYDRYSVAIAIDGEFLPKHKWAKRVLQPGQSIEFIAPMQGG